MLNKIRANVKKQSAKVLAELGKNAVRSSVWDNGLGQIGAYVNEQGLAILAKSKHALVIRPDYASAISRAKAVNEDRSLEAVEADIIAQGKCRG